MTLALRAVGPSSLRYMSAASDDYSRRIGRISSGLRIVRAADDAAGLAIAHKLRAHVNGSATASRNVHDAINLLGTAEGGLDAVTSLLQRARELSVQAANTGTTTAADREAAAAEVRQIVAEVDRIAGATTYNGMRLLDGSRTAGFSFQVGAGAGDALTVRIGDSDATALGLLDSITASTLSSTTTYVARSAPLTTYTSSRGQREFTFSLDGGPAQSFKIKRDVTYGPHNYDALRAELQKNLDAALPPIPVTVRLEVDATGATRLAFTATGSATTSVSVTGTGADALGGVTTESTTTTFAVAATAAPSVADLVAAGSGEAIGRLDAALSRVLSTRTDLGATQNRLEHRLAVLAATQENLGAARSLIEDADMAVEYAALVRAQILGQTGMAMQAQQAAGGRRVLQLLTGLS